MNRPMGKSGDGNRSDRPRDPALFAVRMDASPRYLRARRKEGFISVIAGFSFVGIMLGVATLIIVMAVMNGFRQELHRQDPRPQRPSHHPADGYEADRLRAGRRAHRRRPGRKAGDPAGRRPGAGERRRQLERRAGARHPPAGPAEAARHRQQHPPGHARQFRRGDGVAIGTRLADAARPHARRQRHAGHAARQRHAHGRHAAHQGLSGGGDLRDRHVGIRFDLRLHAVRSRRRPISTSTTRRARSRSISTMPTWWTLCARRSRPPRNGRCC